MRTLKVPKTRCFVDDNRPLIVIRMVSGRKSSAFFWNKEIKSEISL